KACRGRQSRAGLRPAQLRRLCHLIRRRGLRERGVGCRPPRAADAARRPSGIHRRQLVGLPAGPAGGAAPSRRCTRTLVVAGYPRGPCGPPALFGKITPPFFKRWEKEAGGGVVAPPISPGCREGTRPHP